MVCTHTSLIGMSCLTYSSKLSLYKSFIRQHGVEWEHEDASVMLMDYMIDENHIDIEKEDTRMVASLIKGSVPH